MRVIIADNQDITAMGMESLCHLIGAEALIRCRDRRQLMSELLATPECIVILDYTQFDFESVDALCVARSRFAEVRWLLFSDELNEDFLRRTVFQDSAFSIVMKTDSIIEIRGAVESLIAGSRFICQRVTELLLAPKARVAESDVEMLTPTEREVLRLLAMGRTTKEIATERFSSVNTIITHRKNIFRKISVNNVHEATRYAFRAGLVDVAEYLI